MESGKKIPVTLVEFETFYHVGHSVFQPTPEASTSVTRPAEENEEDEPEFKKFKSELGGK